MPTPDEVLRRVIDGWVDDPASDVQYAEFLEGRWAVRMRQETRDATTVWWELGSRSLRAEAYVLPAPLVNQSEVYRLCLVRNQRAWRAHFGIDAEGAVVLRARIASAQVTSVELDLVLGEIYEAVETTFRPLVRLAFPPRENSS